MEAEQCLPLLEIQQDLNDFEIVLPELSRIVKYIEDTTPPGPEVMTLLADKSQCGTPAIMSCCNRLLWHCRQIFLKQLESWVLYGELVDPCHEFLIQHPNAVSAACADADLSFLDEFYVSNALIPPDFSIEESNTVLFIGKATRILRHSKAQHRSSLGPMQDSPEHAVLLKALAEATSSQVLRRASMKRALDTLRTSVASKLWTLLNTECGLQETLKSVHDVYLFGHGDIFQRFIFEASDLLREKSNCNRVSNAAVSIRFDHMIRTAINDGELAFPDALATPELHCLLRPVSSESLPSWHPAFGEKDTIYPPSLDDWDALSLHIPMQWPMALFFPPEIQRKYVAFWQFLFRLNCVLDGLVQVWSSLSKVSRKVLKGLSSTSLVERRRKPYLVRDVLSNLRSRMAHFVTNLALYLRIDVIDGAARILFAGLEECGDFQTAEKLHRDFVDRIVVHACLDVRQLMTAVEAIFAQTRRLQLLVERLLDSPVHAESILEEAIDLDEAFRLKHNLVFQLLQSNRVQEYPRGTTLRQLILRLNYNGWCERDGLKQIRSETIQRTSF